jgi:tRNA(Ile2) C34 agmatinyltransferase TiaS
MSYSHQPHLVEESADDFEDAQAEGHTPECPMCRGSSEELGALGARVWFRCRHCGWSFHSED